MDRTAVSGTADRGSTPCGPTFGKAILRSNFIERALVGNQGLLKLEAERVDSPRQDNIELKKDTKGLAESPAIVESIFQRIRIYFEAT